MRRHPNFVVLALILVTISSSAWALSVCDHKMAASKGMSECTMTGMTIPNIIQPVAMTCCYAGTSKPASIMVVKASTDRASLLRLDSTVRFQLATRDFGRHIADESWRTSPISLQARLCTFLI